jgi:phosphomannomutase
MEINHLLHNVEEVPKDKKLIVFDLDGTLAESKVEMDGEMALLITRLLEAKDVAVIGGGKYSKFQGQFFKNLSLPEELSKKLFLFPANGAAFYRYAGGQWQNVYSREFTQEEKQKILSAFERTFRELNYDHPSETYGELIEDRGSQITFSALGQEAPLELKKKWNRENPDTRLKIEELLQKYLPDMEVKIAGLTSIDVTRQGKDYGLKQMRDILHVPFEEMLFVGDAFYHEGNDEAVLKAGVLCFEVKGPEDTKVLIEHLLK